MKAQCRCGKIVIIPNQQMGQRGDCPRCGSNFLIPILVTSSQAESSLAEEHPKAQPAVDIVPLPPATEPPKEPPKPLQEDAKESTPNGPRDETPPTERLREVKPCPYCGEEILVIAIKCKHCGEWLTQEKRDEAEQAAKSQQPSTPAQQQMAIPFVAMTPVEAPSAPTVQTPRQKTPLATRPCPACGKEILSVATLCRHCGSPTERRPKPPPNRYFSTHMTAMFFSLIAAAAVFFPIVQVKGAESPSFLKENQTHALVVVAVSGMMLIVGAILLASRKFFTPLYLFGCMGLVGMGLLEYFEAAGRIAKSPESKLGLALFLLAGSAFVVLICAFVGFFIKRRHLKSRPKEQTLPPPPAADEKSKTE